MNTSLNTDNPDHKHLLETIFQWMPSNAIIIDTDGNIVETNQQAATFLRAINTDTLRENYTLNDITIEFPRILEIIHALIHDKTNPVRKVLFRRLDKSIACVDISACVVPEHNNLIIIQFIDNSQKNNILYTSLIQTYRHEILRLKPYLNKPGKEIMEEIITANSMGKIVSNKSTQQIHSDLLSEDRIKAIIHLFPELTNTELTLCGFLSIRLTVEDIATLTNKSPNSLRVALHRIIRKTNTANSRGLIRSLESII